MRPLSIRFTLPIIIIAPLFAAVGLVAGFAYLSGRKVVDELAVELSRKASSAIEYHVETYLNAPAILQDGLAAITDSGDLDLASREDVQRLLWQLLRKPNTPSEEIYLGWPNGDFVSIAEEDGQVLLRRRTVETAPDRVTFTLDDNGQIQDEIRRAPYDPRERVWYEAAIEAEAFIWSDVYVYAGQPVLGVTAAQPAYDQDGQLRGVFGVDVSLEALNQFLQMLEISPQGIAYVVERSGELVASSTEGELLNQIGSQSQRILAAQSADPMIRNSAAQLLEELEDFNQVQAFSDYQLRFEGRQNYVGVVPITDIPGIDWVVVVVLPDTDFQQVLLTGVRTTLIVGVSAAIGAAILGILTARWIAIPILQLRRAAAAVETGSYDPELLESVTQRQDELGALGKIFAQMATVLDSREQGLREQMHQLEAETNQAKQAARLAQAQRGNNWQQLIVRSQQLQQQIRDKNREQD
jgi:HAMP domain-containing protein